MSLKNYSTTAASNTSAPPDGAPEGWALGDINAVMRQVMADVRTLAASDTIASATTCDLGSLDATFLTVSGTTTITGLGTVSAGIYKHVTFSGALTLTHNATSLILPGAANITTVAGDTAFFLSLGSGNWKCMAYQRVGGYQPVDALLTALAAQTTAANNVQAYSGADTPTLLSTGTSSGNIPLVGTSSATDALAGLVELATSAEVAAGTDTSRAITPAGLAASKIVAGTAVASTSGTAIDFTGIPSWAKRVTVMLSGVSTSGTSSILFRLGTGGVAETSGYLGSGGYAQNGASTIAANYTAGFGDATASAANVRHYTVQFSKLDGNTWMCHGIVGLSSAANIGTISGSKTLAGTLDMISVTTVNGTDTFDAGTINILYE